MGMSNPRAFSEWLRAQLRAKKMSQRQLAQQSGVDHSTISRLVRGDRMPSLGTALALARGLRELGDVDEESAAYLAIMAAGNRNPAARVEYALRADDYLSDPDVRLLMDHYLALRARRMNRAQGLDRPGIAPLPPVAGAGNGAGYTGARTVAFSRPPLPAARPVRPVASVGDRAEARVGAPPGSRERY
jgi:transcriptional regulator with XRE-family HTH domain